MSRPRSVLLAPDSFKGSLDAASVAAHLAAGLRAADPTLDVRSAPIGDGGEGTVAALLAAGWERRTAPVSGPTGEPVEATYAVEGRTALVELAESSGLGRLPGGRLAPWRADTRGVGEQVRAAVASGARTVIVGLGGSASTDGGTGLLQALGARVLDTKGRPVGPGAAHLADVALVDLAPARALLAGAELVVACDVDSPLVGPRGAARVFGPQKGLGHDELDPVDDTLAALAAAVGHDPATPGAGAAGGAGYALLALGARFEPGIEVVTRLTGLAAAVARADLVVVGEGRLDEQSLAGKGPVGVARTAHDAGVRAVAVVGSCAVAPEHLAAAGLAEVLELVSLEPDVERCRARAGPLLEALAHRLVPHAHAPVPSRAEPAPGRG